MKSAIVVATIVHALLIFSIINNLPYVVVVTLVVSGFGVFIQTVVVYARDTDDYLQRVQKGGGHPKWNDLSLLWPLATICVLGYYQHTVEMLVLVAIMLISRSNMMRSEQLYRQFIKRGVK